jgi:hypothetical protein
MVKRIVLEHLSGLRQICGIMDIVADADCAPQLALRGDTYTLVKATKRYVSYREFDPTAANAVSGQTAITDPTEVTP